jgi:hypothetical protein
MLPFADRIMLTDYSANNVRWLRHHVVDEDAPWTWQPFWDEMRTVEGYHRISEPHKQLREACAPKPGLAGVEQCSVFDLPPGRWQVGTMFFVAESITEEPEEFREAVGCFVGALKHGAPFATAFMGGSKGYLVDRTPFPSVPISEVDVKNLFTDLGARDLSVWQTQGQEKVRKGYEAMIVATGIAGG